jgi:hypothetical protein
MPFTSKQGAFSVKEVGEGSGVGSTVGVSEGTGVEVTLGGVGSVKVAEGTAAVVSAGLGIVVEPGPAAQADNNSKRAENMTRFNFRLVFTGNSFQGPSDSTSI